MAAQKSKEKSDKKNETKAMKAEKKEAKPEEKKRPWPIYVGIIIALLIVIAVVGFIASNTLTGVSFSSFKQNYESAPKVAIIDYYNNASVSGMENICSTYMVQVLSAKRNPATIDFYVMENNTCTYLDGLGKPANLSTATEGACLSMIGSEPSISLSYSAVNQTTIMPYNLKVSGNAAYLSSCPIAVGLS